MSIDLAQFQQLFFEESYEGVDSIEAGLLSLDSGEAEQETINIIFRAAHSIKGGSGTFGFTELSDFTHLMETLLDEMRDGRRQVTETAVKVLLTAVDCLRELLTALDQQQNIDERKLAECKHLLLQELSGDHASDTGVADHTDNDQGSDKSEQRVWEITFKPHASMLQTGNDPVRIFRELKSLGELDCQLDSATIPDFHDLQPTRSYLSWRMSLVSDCSLADIEEVFEWVEDECDLTINQPAGQDACEVQAESNKPAQTSSKTSLPQKAKPPAITQQVQSGSSKSSASIRVDIQKIDKLINMVGELVITQSMLRLLGEDFDISKRDQLNNGLSQMERHTRELQESVLNIRMMPISFIFSRFPRLVHDISEKLGKKIELQLSGEHTEVDKTVVEMLTDPLVHLVRNSLDHGIEMPDERLAAGKPETGIITLNAFQRNDNIIVEIKDDGRGLDKDRLVAKAIEKGLISADSVLTEQQIFELIFMPGFSAADTLTDISGRGVGMDVVRQNIQQLGGEIQIHSEAGKGTDISIYLPLTLAIVDGQSIAVGDEHYILPLGAVIETSQVDNAQINRLAGGGETIEMQGEFILVIRLHQIFDIPNAKAKDLTEGLIVVVEGQGVKCGLFIDRLLGQQQAVIKSLENNYRKVEGISAATILGDGSVALILDIPGLLRLAQNIAHE